MTRPPRVLHIAPHLGGGVGKAHAALAETALERPASERVEHIFALLEEPRDIAFAQRVRDAGCALHVAPDLGTLQDLSLAADIVQIEWWNHPRLYSLLTTNILPEMRLVLWLHVSGLSTPLIPPTLVDLADQSLFTAACSFKAENLRSVIASRPGAFGLANSGFGWDHIQRRPRPTGERLRLGYLGTLDFVKMHPQFFDFIDALDADVCVSLWGRHDENGETAKRAAAMRHPARVKFEGFTLDPVKVLSNLDLFVYLLTPNHYGTAENALVEAISAGAIPVVFDNPAETCIVKAGETGFVIHSQADFVSTMEELIDDPGRLITMQAAGRLDMAARYSPRRTIADFDEAYKMVMQHSKRPRDFATALGRNASTWFLASLAEKGEAMQGSRLLADSASKGSLGHFRACLPQDDSLATIVPAITLRTA